MAEAVAPVAAVKVVLQEVAERGVAAKVLVDLGGAEAVKVVERVVAAELAAVVLGVVV